MRVRLLAFLGGSVLFLLVHTLLALTAVPITGVENETTGWFLNSGRGVAAVALVFAIAGALVDFSAPASVKRP